MSGRAGLLVIDMQNSFCDPKGIVVGLGLGLFEIDRVVEQNAAAVQAARAAGMPVVFTRHCYQPGYLDTTPLDIPVQRQVEAAGGLIAGSWDADTVAALERSPGDAVVDKCRYDAFYGTSLAAVLRHAGITDLVVTGVLTNVCVETTVRSATVRDLGCTVLGDCCTSQRPEDHASSLECLERYGFATVTTLEEHFGRPAPAVASA